MTQTPALLQTGFPEPDWEGAEEDLKALTTSRSAADLGIERAASKTTRIDPKWIDDTVLLAIFVIDFLYINDHFTMEQVRAHCGAVPDGVDQRVWGVITRKLIRNGNIEPTGEYAATASSNGSPKMKYKRGPKA